MVIFEGSNHKLRGELRRAFLNLAGERWQHFASGAAQPSDVRWLTRLVHVDNRYHVREGLPMELSPHHGARHMVASGLQATGSVLVVCEHVPGARGWEERYQPVPGALPVLGITTVSHPNVYDVAQTLLELASSEVARASRTYDQGGSGYNYEPDLLIVGEKVSPYRPLHVERRGAFISTNGCSSYLHAALMATGARSYLTNAIKTGRVAEDRERLAGEVRLVQADRVVAMGATAARYLADAGVEPVTVTYHPQYWKRFKNKDFGQLVELLRPTSPNQTT